MTAPFLAPSRDNTQRQGRYVSTDVNNYYSLPGVAYGTTNDRTLTINNDHYGFIHLTAPMVIDQLAVHVSTSPGASNVRFGLYAADLTWQPLGGPITDSGSVSAATTGIKTFTPGTPIYLPKGRYLTVINADASGIALRTTQGSLVYPGPPTSTSNFGQMLQEARASRTYAAFANPGTQWFQGGAGSAPFHYMVFLRPSAA